MGKCRGEIQLVNNGRLHRMNVTLDIQEDRIEFTSIPFSKALNAEIKAMRGWKWHGYDSTPRKIWSIENCPRNLFQLQVLLGNNPHAHWEQPLKEIEFGRPLQAQQVDMCRHHLTYHYHLSAAEMGLGKSLAAIQTMECAAAEGATEWWYVGFLSAISSFEDEIVKWGLDPSVKLTIMTYEELVQRIRYEYDDIKKKVPHGIIIDEISGCKTATAQRTIAAQGIADLIREAHGMNGYVIGLSGTPSAKHPTDLWAQLEIIFPGFLREGNAHEFERRYAVMEQGEDADGVKFMKRVGWNEAEIAQLPNRYAGLMKVYRKLDWLDLPEKKFKIKYLKPNKKVERVARSLAKIAPNTITALTWLRALSSGFQYVNKKIGDKECPVCKGTGEYTQPDECVCPGCGGLKVVPQYERETVKVETPKDKALGELIDSQEERGRIVVAACFQGSIDRCKELALSKGWSCVVVDGRGWFVLDKNGIVVKGINPITYWREHKEKVCFIGNPGSCRFGLTLTAASMLVWYDMNFSAEHFLQMCDRIHRIGMDPNVGATIVILLHLPADSLVYKTLKDNQKVEALSLGIIRDACGEGEDSGVELAEVA